MPFPSAPYSVNGVGSGNLGLSLLGANGLPLNGRGPGRPRNVDWEREFTIGSSESALQNLNGPNDLVKLGGSVDEVDVRLGWRTKEQIDQDPVASASLDTLVLGATARPMEIEPAPKACFLNEGDDERADELAAFCRRAMIHLAVEYRDPNLICFRDGRAAIKIGHQKAEIVSSIQQRGADAGKRFIDRVKGKNRTNSCPVIDRQGNLVSVAAYTGDYANYSVPNGPMLYGNLGAGWELLPREKWLFITNNPPEDDSVLGTSIYTRIYNAWQMKMRNWAYYLHTLDNTAQPFVVAERPEHEYDLDSYPWAADGPDISKPKIPGALALYQSVKQGRHGGVTVVPHGASVQQLYNAASGDPHATALNVYDSQIIQGILLQKLATGESRHMARAAGQVHQDILSFAIRNTRRMICDAWRRDVLTMFVKQNKEKEYWHLIPVPSFGDVDLEDFAAWADAFAKLVKAGVAVPSQFPFIWAILGMPQGDLAEVNAALTAAQAQSSAEPFGGATAE
jgi:Protein of unknown function (DUF935)